MVETGLMVVHDAGLKWSQVETPVFLPFSLQTTYLPITLNFTSFNCCINFEFESFV